MIRQAIAREQLASAQAHLEELRAYSFDDGIPAPIGRLWAAEDRNWYWALQVQAGRLTEVPERAEQA